MTERDMQLALYYRHRSSACAILPNYTPPWWYECDLYVVMKSMLSVEYEIKTTRSDFRADFGKREKHARLSKLGLAGSTPTRFFFVVPEGLVTADEVPTYAGLMYARPNPSYKRTTLTVLRKAPRLNGKQLTEKTIREMHRISYYRFWNLKARLT